MGKRKKRKRRRKDEKETQVPRDKVLLYSISLPWHCEMDLGRQGFCRASGM